MKKTNLKNSKKEITKMEYEVDDELKYGYGNEKAGIPKKEPFNSFGDKGDYEKDREAEQTTHTDVSIGDKNTSKD